MAKFLAYKKDGTSEEVNITNLKKNELLKATKYIEDTRWHYRTDRKGRIKNDNKGNGVKAGVIIGVSIV